MNSLLLILKFFSPLLIRQDKAIILTFHRVLPERDSLQPSIITGQEFADVVKYVSKIFHVISLSQLVHSIKNDEIRRGTVVFTFDDGYADNCEIAMPILKQYGCVGTFFVSTGYLDGGQMWNDIIVDVIRQAQVPELDFSELDLGKINVSTTENKIKAIGSIIEKIKHLDPDEREKVVNRMVKLAQASIRYELMMTTSQVKTMHESGMEIGAHTVSHPILSSTTAERGKQEIVESKQALEAIIDSKVTLFAYPNGKPGVDYNQYHINVLNEAGFLGAVSTEVNLIDVKSDVFQMPRFTPWDKTGFKFSLRLIKSLF